MLKISISERLQPSEMPLFTIDPLFWNKWYPNRSQTSYI